MVNDNIVLKSMTVLILLFMSSGSMSAPYENLSFALRQQVMVNDLRTQCRISQAVSDEKIRSAFMADADNHVTLIRAADALKSGNRQQYV